MLCPKCSTSLEDGAKFCATCGNTVDTTEKDPFLGRILLNQYVVQRKLGEGGYGAVYEAEQPAFRRKVAIKMLHKHLTSDPKVVKRFHREGMVASQLEQNPSAVKMLNVGETEDGYLWIAMEYIQGETLDDRIQRKPLTIPELLEIMGPVCNLLDEAHQKTIVHRDLKPDNIMLAQHQGKLVVKVLDFGIAGIVESDDASRPTKTGVVTGTPPYMPPEQWRGLKHTDARSDVYALGIIVYECLSGKLPFEADTVPDWMIRHVMQAPRQFAEVMANNPPPKSVEQAVLKAIEKEPKDRYQSAGEFFRALRASADGPDTAPDLPRQSLKATTPHLAQPSPATTPTMPHMPMPSINVPTSTAAPQTIATPPPTQKKTGLLVGGAAVVALLAGGVWFLGGNSTGKTVAPSVDIALPGSPSDPNAPAKGNPEATRPRVWQPLASGTQADLYAISGSAANNVYAVGAGGTILHSTDAKTWTSNELDLSGGGGFVTPGQVPELITDVWASGSGEAFLVYESTIFRGTMDNWIAFPIARRGEFSAVWSPPGGPITVAGDEVYTSSDGVRWLSGDGLGRRAQVLSLWGRDGGPLFAAGEDGLLSRSLDRGQRWVNVETNTEVSFHEIRGGASQVYVAGDGGVLLASDSQGTSWKQVKTNVNSALHGLWVTANGSIYVVGSGGLILFSADQGKTWTKQDSQTSNTLRGIWGSPSDLFFAVGDKGTILTLQ